MEDWYQAIQEDFRKKTPEEESNFRILMNRGGFILKGGWMIR
jgi:predicted nucleic acid-binding Zn ribbon protein